MTGVDSLIAGWVAKNVDALKRLIVDLCRIPSPTGNERKKADFVRDLICRLPGCGSAGIDEAGNVVLLYDPGTGTPPGDSDTLLVAAHIDTVFEDLDAIDPVERDGRLYAPSSGDNCANVAGLITALRFFVESGLRPDRKILFAFTVGEEGTGNLRGMRHLLSTRRTGIGEAIAVDGTLESVMNEAVASRRFMIRVTAPGGHSWHDYGNANAVVEAAALSAEIYGLEVPVVPRTTYNIGVFRGGTSINTIAAEAEFTLDMRSVDNASLRELERQVFRLVENRKKAGASENVNILPEFLGERPGGSTPPGSPLVGRIEKLRREQGLPFDLHASSTDANIPISLGIPAVTFGIYRGEGAHTLSEYIELDSLAPGLCHLISVLRAS